MSGPGRKIRRNKEKLAKKEMRKKLGLFDKLGNECLSCEKPFDKKSKEQVQTWNVVVRREQQKVNLYCPECWSAAQKLIKHLKEENDN